jgi:hypothetical protein
MANKISRRFGLFGLDAGRILVGALLPKRIL